MFRRKSNSDGIATLAAQAISARVMVADENFNIVFMNEAVTSMLKEAEADLRKELPNFNVAKLIGTNIDIFHKNPSHQRRMLEGLNSVHRATIKVGSWTFDLARLPPPAMDTLDRTLSLAGMAVLAATTPAGTRVRVTLAPWAALP